MSKRSGINRNKIIEASLLLIQQQGESSLTLAALAKELGVKSPSLYNHITGLPGLKRELRLYGLEQLGSELQKAVIGYASTDALTKLCLAYRNFAQQHSTLYQMTLASTEQDDDELRTAGRNCLNIILAILRGYNLSDEAALHATRCLRSALHGFVSLEIEGGFAMPLDLDTSYSHLIHQLDRMLKEWPQE